MKEKRKKREKGKKSRRKHSRQTAIEAHEERVLERTNKI
jgi:hypothetical protein